MEISEPQTLYSTLNIMNNASKISGYLDKYSNRSERIYLVAYLLHMLQSTILWQESDQSKVFGTINLF